MKILSCHLENFGSYKELDFNFENQGSTLLHGSTGSGKSTLMDAVPWVLFGVTAKNGKADEVKSWYGGQTEGSLYLDHPTITRVVRIRGSKSSDLYYETYSSSRVRGKDVLDTQKQINTLLGFDSDLYLAGAYYHEFSQTSQFFTTTAKIRRSITEQLVDLSLAKSLNEKASSQLKDTRTEILILDNKISSSEFYLKKLNTIIQQEKEKSKSWNLINSNKIKELTKKVSDWDQARDTKRQEITTKINNLEVIPDKIFIGQLKEYDRLIASVPVEICQECLCDTKNQQLINSYIAGKQLVERKMAENASSRTLKLTLQAQIDSLENSPYTALLEQALVNENPHELIQYSLNSDADSANRSIGETRKKLDDWKMKEQDLDTLQDVIIQFRSLLVENTVLSLQRIANELLNDHFDAELRVELSVADNDKLDVIIYKDGNEASFTQLSKGQRQILKLCFSIAVMKAVQQHHSINFEQIFIDEALEGLDESMKLKAFGLLEKLSLDYNSVFVIDHSESVKAMANNKYEVTMVNGESQIAKAE